MTDLQKASISKRISAFLFDLILVATVAVAIGALLSWALGYDGYSQTWDEKYAFYEEEYGVDFDITQEDYEKLSEEALKPYEAAMKALNEDTEAMRAYTMMFSLALLILTASLFIAILVWEFVIPLFLKNGQTLGKKVFGIALMRTDGVRITTFSLFVRALLGKYTVETMIPVLMLVMLFFNTIGTVGLVVLAGILLLEIFLMIATHTNSMIHDVFAVTVVVDYHSQKIFDSVEDMIAYKKRIHAEQAAKKDY